VDLPNMVQAEEHTCGPAAVLAICAYYGVGPASEAEVERDLGTTVDGTDPDQIVACVRRYGLEVQEHRPMTTEALIACLDRRRPVVMMLQAWAEPAPRSYRDRWDHGHWVVAIGYDRRGVYLEDPALAIARGFLDYAALDDRWHDIEGEARHRVERYGVAIWRPRAGSAYARAARVVG
jgi:ABC-type bacteriocin/lantibiotic exporter with double-glycine peptidase domain